MPTNEIVLKKDHKYTNLCVFLLLAVFLTLSISSIWSGRKSATCDELAHHIPVGYVLLTKWDFKLDTSHPPLSRYIIALPLKVFMNLAMPTDKSEWRRADRAGFGKDFFYKYNTQPDKILFLSRLAVIAVGFLCGLLLFSWARALYGNKVALFSLFLYVFCPNILANTSLATTDMVAACFMLLSVATFWIFVRKPLVRNSILAGIALGLAQLSKYSLILLYPMFIFLLVFELIGLTRSDKKSLIFKMAGVIFISFFVLWLGYGLDFKPILSDAMRIEEKIGILHTLIKKVLPSISTISLAQIDNFLTKFPIPLGTHLLGILGILRHGYEGHSTYFLGTWSGHGNPFYFLVAFLIKTPIPMLILFFCGLVLTLKRRLERNERFILSAIAVFFVASSFSKLQLGLRYILPVYPFCFILAARSLGLYKRGFLKIAFILLACWYVLSNLWIWPNYLSYFNELIGGPKNGYKYLRDSNIDWGQDLPALGRYLKKNKINNIKLLYFGTANPNYYGIKYRDLDNADLAAPQRDIYAISAHKLEAVSWAFNSRPKAQIGYSIFIYDFREPNQTDK